MTIAVGDKLPDATFIASGPNGPEPKTTADIFSGRKVALFAVPGAYTGTCTTVHLPGFVEKAKELGGKGVEAICCVSVNDPFVLKAWAEAGGALDAGIQMLADPQSEFTKAIGMDFTAPPAGLIDRSKRYSMIVDDGVVTTLNLEDSPGETKVSTAEVMLTQL